jgi:hypothetical protein
MRNFLLFWLGLGLLSSTLIAAEPSLLTPLASAAALPCSVRPGVRSIQSGLVQFGDVTASLSAQSTRQNTREKNACTQSAALWVTQNGVSQQFDLPDAKSRVFNIVDVAPDASAILISAVTTLPNGQGYSTEVGVVSLADGVFRWTLVSDMLGFQNCDAAYKPQGFSDAKHIVVAAAPALPPHRYANCTPETQFYLVDLDLPRVKPLRSIGLHRLATAASGPAGGTRQACKTDPDVVGACYSTRARLALGTGEDLLVWPIGSPHFMAAEEQMVPGVLRSELTHAMRVYATMVLCPMQVEHREKRQYVCVESATDLRPDPISPNNITTVVLGPSPTAGDPH